MADQERAIERLVATLVSVARHPLSPWLALVLVHVWLGQLNLYGPGSPMGDVIYVYKFWVEQYVANGFIVGVDGEWVYPIVAFVPMLCAWAFGPAAYGSTWLGMILILDLIAFGVLTGWGRRRDRVDIAWWWVLYLFVLGPIALGRIDSVTVPLAIVGMLLLASRPRAAAVILAVATWIKVWPAALIAAILVASRHRIRVLVAITVTSLAVLAVAFAMGSGANVLSFISQQTGRGLQVEAPVSTIWLWIARSGAHDTFVYFNREILTFQVDGSGSAVAAAVMTPLFAVAVIVIALLGVRATRRGAGVAELLPPLALALVTAFIVFNKVGSPQFQSWLAVPVIFGLVSATRASSFRVPAILTLVTATLTQIIYPTFYDRLLALDPVMLVVITTRNLLLVVLLVWAVVAVVRLGSAPQSPHAEGQEATTWPLAS